MVEHERSYVFSYDAAKNFIDIHSAYKHIKDYYIDSNCRVRLVNGQYLLTEKTGDKSKGYRLEKETEIAKSVGEILIARAKFMVEKKRFRIVNFTDKLAGEFDDYEVTMDLVESPMQIGILEIEAKKEIVYPIPVDITQRMFGMVFKECPLSSYNFFNRKVGICGGPSSGKSETSKYISHVLNTKYKANSFHVTEFATTFIQKYDRAPQFLDQFFVWYGQRDREMGAERSNIVISDCPTFLTYIYMMHYNTSNFDFRSALFLSKMYKRVLFDMLDRYTDLIFLRIQNYQENNVRYQSRDEALKIEDRIFRFLQDHRIPFVEATYNDTDKIIKDLFYINE